MESNSIDRDFSKLLTDNKQKGNYIWWDADKIAEATEKVNMGYKFGLKEPSPFFFNDNADWKRGNLVYHYSQKEIETLQECAHDALTFAQDFGYLKTPNGFDNILLRDYQIEMLKLYQEENRVVVLASRQIGKCVSWNTTITILIDNIEKEIKFYEFYFSELKKSRKLTWIESLKYWIFKYINY